MKDPRLERMTRLQRLNHRKNPWPLSKDGLYIPHCYKSMQPDALSWGDDVGFILNQRKVFVDWSHPRCEYAEEIRSRASLLAGEDPCDDWVLNGITPQYKKVGLSRKKIVRYICRSPSNEQLEYDERKQSIEHRLSQEGIAHHVSCAWKRLRQDWATHIFLVVPLEVRNEVELAQVATLARSLLLGQTTLDAAFPNYCYSKADWLSEASQRRGGFSGNGLALGV
jgi:hypothetical protein